MRLPGMDAMGFAAMDTAVLGTRRITPPDCIFHANGPTADGWCVLDFYNALFVAADQSVHA